MYERGVPCLLGLKESCLFTLIDIRPCEPTNEDIVNVIEKYDLTMAQAEFCAACEVARSEFTKTS